MKQRCLPLTLAVLVLAIVVVAVGLIGAYGGHSKQQLSASTNIATVAANIRAALPATDVQAVSESEIPGLYRFQAGGNTLYADATGRYLLVGHIYDLHTAQDVTATDLPPSVYGQPAGQ